MQRSIGLRVGARSAALAASLVIVTGCGFDPDSRNSAPSAILGGGIDDELDAMALLDPAVYTKIGDCLESAKFQVYVGDPEWQQTWDEVGRTAAGLRGVCEDLAVNDPSALDAIHTEWVAWEIATGASVAETTPPPPPTVLTPTTPPPVLSSPDGCHPSYTPCIPIALDVDCKGPGNGPVFVVGPFQVIGYDEYNIDDGDGVACEPE
jgi:hypothetical protein